MAKHIALDSIARSGTTLMSALLRSQEKTIAFCPGFNEPLACKGIDETMWPHEICRKDFLENAQIDLEEFKKDSLKYILDFNQRYGLDEAAWHRIINRADSEFEIRENLDNAFSEVNYFSYRWNQSNFYFKKWVSNGPNYLWVTMIRNPMDRACSSFQKHKWTLSDSLKNTISFAKKLEHMKNHKQFYCFYYEDLIDRPEDTLKDLYSFFGSNVEKINLENVIGSNGKPFKPQTSFIRDVYSREDGYLSAAKNFEGLYNSQINRYQTDCWTEPVEPIGNGREYRIFGEENCEVFKKELGEFSIYSRYFTNEREPRVQHEHLPSLPLNYNYVMHGMKKK